jgi:MFS superfamily sulfate permease-like transporter
VVALDMSRVPDIEYSALQALVEGQKRATERGIIVWIAGLNPGALEVARRSELADRLGPEGMLFNARAAIEKYQRMRAGERVGSPVDPAQRTRAN